MPRNGTQSGDCRRLACLAHDVLPISGNGLMLHKMDLNEHATLLLELTGLTQARTMNFFLLQIFEVWGPMWTLRLLGAESERRTPPNSSC